MDTAYLILLHLILLHLEELARNAEGVLVALGAQAEAPEFFDETRGIFVEEAAKGDLKLLWIGLRDAVSKAVLMRRS